MSDLSDMIDRVDGASVTRCSSGVAGLLEQHEPFVRSRVLRWLQVLPHLAMHEDDLMQEGRVALWKAWERYDEARGVVFLTFAGKWVDNLLRNFVWRRSQLVRCPHGRKIELLYLDAPMDGEEEWTMHGALVMPAVEEQLSGDEWAREMVLEAMQSINARLARVLWLRHAQWLRFQEIGLRLGVSKQRAVQLGHAALHAVKDRLREKEARRKARLRTGV